MPWCRDKILASSWRIPYIFAKIYEWVFLVHELHIFGSACSVSTTYIQDCQWQLRSPSGFWLIWFISPAILHSVLMIGLISLSKWALVFFSKGFKGILRVSWWIFSAKSYLLQTWWPAIFLRLWDTLIFDASFTTMIPGKFSQKCF